MPIIQINNFSLGKSVIYYIKDFRSSRHGSVETNLSSIYEEAGSIPGLTQWVTDVLLL